MTFHFLYTGTGDTETPKPAIALKLGGQERPGASPLPGYTTSEEHLWHHLQRIDQLVRAQVVRWQQTQARHKPPDHWGMVSVSEDEVRSYLACRFVAPGTLPPGLEEPLQEYWSEQRHLAEVIHGRRENTSKGVLLRLERLRQEFDLKAEQRDILLICLLPALEARYRRLFGLLQDDAARTACGVELALEIIYHCRYPESSLTEAFAWLGSDAPLRSERLLVLAGDTPEAPWPQRSLIVDNRIRGYLLGSDAPDARVAGVLTRPPLELSLSDLLVDEDTAKQLDILVQWWHRDVSGERRAVFFFHGPEGVGRLQAARALCKKLHVGLLVADAGQALDTSSSWEQTVDLIYREARLAGVALYWKRCDRLLAPNPQDQQSPRNWEVLTRAAQRHAGLVFLAAESVWEPAGAFHDLLYLRLDFPTPEYALRCKLWNKHLGEAGIEHTPALREELANAFQLTGGQVRDAIVIARGLAVRRHPQQPRVSRDDLFAACRGQSSRFLVSFSRRVEPRPGLGVDFERLVLPRASKTQLNELRDRIKHHSRVRDDLGFGRRLSLGGGLVTLFTGASGTGKTMAAGMLAQERGRDLYKVDVAAVVSRYVGDTEKNLSRLFDEAQDTNAILFFDEADAIFGQRGEVKDANDRWANLEVNFLLQRIEEYPGVIVLATNLRQNIDPAFLRRIQMVVEFPFPDEAARFEIWLGMFPATVGRPADADIAKLKKFSLPGGSIRNAVLYAAHRAVADAAGQAEPEAQQQQDSVAAQVAAGVLPEVGGIFIASPTALDPQKDRMASQPGAAVTITLRHLVAAVGREIQRQGKPITVREFGPEFHDWVMKDLFPRKESS